MLTLEELTQIILLDEILDDLVGDVDVESDELDILEEMGY